MRGLSVLVVGIVMAGMAQAGPCDLGAQVAYPLSDVLEREANDVLA